MLLDLTLVIGLLMSSCHFPDSFSTPERPLAFSWDLVVAPTSSKRASARSWQILERRSPISLPLWKARLLIAHASCMRRQQLVGQTHAVRQILPWLAPPANPIAGRGSKGQKMVQFVPTKSMMPPSKSSWTFCNPMNRKLALVSRWKVSPAQRALQIPQRPLRGVVCFNE